MDREKNNAIDQVFIVTTSCRLCQSGIPDDYFGHHIRIVSNDFSKAYKVFEQWVKNMDSYMERHGFRKKLGDDFQVGDGHCWKEWERHTNEFESTSVEIKQYKVEN